MRLTKLCGKSKMIFDISSIFIESFKDLRGGAPVLSRTRIPVSRILADLSAERSISEIAEEFGLEKSLICGAIADIAFSLREPPIKKEPASVKGETVGFVD